MEFRAWMENEDLDAFYRDNEGKALAHPEVQRQLKTLFQADGKTLRSIVGKGPNDESGPLNQFIRTFNDRHGNHDRHMRLPWDVRHPRPTEGPGKEPAISPEDLQWFQGSKVTERDGSPKVVHHGTTERFDRFEAGEFGFHFGDEDAAGMMGDTGRFLLRITNPIRLKDLGVWDPATVLKAVTAKLGARADAKLAELPPELRDDLEQDDDMVANRRAHYRWSGPAREFIKSLGHDGIVYRNEAEGFQDSYIAFDHDQIRRIGPQ
jgi:hypothetical protein